MRHLIGPSIWILALASAASAAPPEGHWQGVMQREGASLTVRFDFVFHAGALTGSFTSETQRAMEYPLDKVAYMAPRIHWLLGDSLKFDGVVSAQSISGTFSEGDGKGTFFLSQVEVPPPPYRREDITFHNGAVTIAGTLLVPGGPGLHPGVVFLHGSGPESRWGTSLFLADRLARSGVAAIVSDKRGTGQSTGDWKTANFDDLAGDYAAAVRFLQHQPGVNPKQVGIYGHSQGGTISPLIASRAGGLAFIIAAAAIGTGQLYTQDLYRTRNELLDAGFKEPDLTRAMNLYAMWIDAMRTGKGLDAFNRASERAKSEKWFAALEIPSNDNWIWKWYPPVGNFNPLPYWEKVKVPVLLIYGERDTNTPVDPSLAAISQALAKAGNNDYTGIIIPGAVHNLTIQPERGKPFFWWHAAPGFTELLTAWVRLRFPETK